MAQRTTVVLIDDLDATPADTTVEFGIDGVSYEIDLNDLHHRSLREELAPFLARARRVGGRRRAPIASAPPKRRTGATPSTVDPEQNKAIREWAGRHGHPMSRRGRIPAAVVAAFHQGDPAALPSTSAATAPMTPTVSSSASTSPSEGAGQSTVGPDGLTGEERESIRRWAVSEGIEVKARGRLSKDLIANFRSVQRRR